MQLRVRLRALDADELRERERRLVYAIHHGRGPTGAVRALAGPLAAVRNELACRRP